MKKEETTKEFENEVLGISRVERMTKGGRRLRFRSVVVSGNRKGKVGVGKGKGRDAQESIEKAIRDSQRLLLSVPITDDGSIPHEVKAKFGAAVILLKPQVKGKGVVAGGTVRTVCAMCGIKNISGKMIGKTRNKLNNALATLEALKMLKISKKMTEKSVTQNETPVEPTIIEEKTKKKEVKEKKPVTKTKTVEKATKKEVKKKEDTKDTPKTKKPTVKKSEKK